eukprot:TRINITY_DN915_c0_g1_i1.p2 TRINITY_DN915_c0_g1~~TRINITY_DN915_c0_g1_i1.p2  ORF type:complete len:114 (-),score=23.06 TRINITY_DN915_c0_g1_i1:27-368(-)
MEYDIPSKCYLAPTGYPAAAPWSGQNMVQSYAQQDRFDHSLNPATRSVPSTLNGGSSGGPWIYNIDINSPNSASVNTVAGLNSYLYPGRNFIYSPVFDTQVKNLYSYAASSAQ